MDEMTLNKAIELKNELDTVRRIISFWEKAVCFSNNEVGARCKTISGLSEEWLIPSPDTFDVVRERNIEYWKDILNRRQNELNAL